MTNEQQEVQILRNGQGTLNEISVEIPVQRQVAADRQAEVEEAADANEVTGFALVDLSPLANQQFMTGVQKASLGQPNTKGTFSWQWQQGTPPNGDGNVRTGHR
ncbi:MAG: hypothetical protein ACR2PL_16955 [Dehalococcoidia bacterium]